MLCVRFRCLAICGWIRSYKDIAIANLIYHKWIHEVAISLIHPPIHNKTISIFTIETIFSLPKFTSVFVGVHKLNVAPRIPLDLFSMSCFPNKSINKLWIFSIFEFTNTGCLLLLHAQGNLNWLHVMSIFWSEPVHWPRNSANLDCSFLLIALEMPLVVLNIILRVKNSEAHLVLLPYVIKLANFIVAVIGIFLSSISFSFPSLVILFLSALMMVSHELKIT